MKEKTVQNGIATQCARAFLALWVVAACAAAQGETYWAKITSGGSIPSCLTFYSDEACTTTASVTPTANDGNTYVIRWYGDSEDYKVESYNGTGIAWQIGTMSKRPKFCSNGSATYNFGNCTIYAVSLRNNGNGLSKMAGTYTFVRSNYTIDFSAVNEYQNKARGFDFTGTFISDDDVVVNFGTDGWSTPYSDYVLSGTFSDYKGRFTVSKIGVTTIQLKSASAFGHSGTAMNNYLTINKGVSLIIEPGVTQYATKGITFNLGNGETAFIQVDESKPLTLVAPIYGSTGTFAKTGTGTLTLATSVETENISVNAGTLIVDSTASFAPGTTMVVSNGATVVSRVGSNIPNVTLDIKEGGSFSYDFTVPFNGSTATTMDYTSLTAEDRAALTKPIAISLSQKIALPQNTSMNLAVARFSASAGFEAADFTDGTAKTFGLPNTTFSMSEPDNGIITLTMAVKPVIVRTGGNQYSPLYAQYTHTGGNPPTYSSTHVWSDELAAHPGADYVHTNGNWGSTTLSTFYGWDSNTRTFDGDSLYLTSPLYMKSSKLVLPPTTFAGDGQLYDTDWSPSLHTYAGGPFILNVGISFFGAYYENSGTKYIRYSVEAPVRGTGNLSLSCKGYSTNPSYLKGDNSQLKGKVMFTHYQDPSGVGESARFEVSSRESFGGARDAVTADGRKITKYSIVRPQQTMTLNAVNRGVTIDGYGGFDVGDGKVLTIANPVALAGDSGSLIKMGAGSLKLDGAVTRSGANTIAVDEGWLTAPADDVANDADVVFASGTGLEIDLTAVSGNGLKLTRANALSFADSRLKVRFSNTAAAEEAHTQFSVAICTVPTGSSLAADSFAYVRSCKGYDVTIRKETLDGYDRFVADCVPKGIMLIVL